jgi:hypothetical protein
VFLDAMEVMEVMEVMNFQAFARQFCSQRSA